MLKEGCTLSSTPIRQSGVPTAAPPPTGCIASDPDRTALQTDPFLRITSSSSTMACLSCGPGYKTPLDAMKGEPPSNPTGDQRSEQTESGHRGPPMGDPPTLCELWRAWKQTERRLFSL
ncbi:unnamed protein product [Arctogadus glacialis]